MDAVSLAGVSMVAQHGVRRLLLVAERQEWCFLVFSYGLPSYPVLRAAAGADCAWPPVSHGGFWKNFLFHVPLSRCSHLEFWTLPLPSYLSVLRCLGVACGVRRIFGTCALLGSTVVTLFCGRLWANFTYFLRAVNSDPRRSLSILQLRSVHS